jgi:hypothetical protein
LDPGTPSLESEMASSGRRDVVPGRTDVVPAEMGDVSRRRDGTSASRGGVPPSRNRISAWTNAVPEERNDVQVSRDDVPGRKYDVLRTPGRRPEMEGRRPGRQGRDFCFHVRTFCSVVRPRRVQDLRPVMPGRTPWTREQKRPLTVTTPRNAQKRVSCQRTKNSQPEPAQGAARCMPDGPGRICPERESVDSGKVRGHTDER